MNGWSVHVIGADDIHPAPDMQAAINLADRINNRIRNTANYYGADEARYEWAVPVPPNHQAARHHHPHEQGHQMSNGYEEKAAHFAAEARKANAALDRVREIHQPIEAVMNPGSRHERIVKVCTGCGTDDGNWQRWPCPTIKALEAK